MEVVVLVGFEPTLDTSLMYCLFRWATGPLPGGEHYRKILTEQEDFTYKIKKTLLSPSFEGVTGACMAARFCRT